MGINMAKIDGYTGPSQRVGAPSIHPTDLNDNTGPCLPMHFVGTHCVSQGEQGRNLVREDSSLLTEENHHVGYVVGLVVWRRALGLQARPSPSLRSRLSLAPRTEGHAWDFGMRDWNR